jgi:hypothetical protein
MIDALRDDALALQSQFDVSKRDVCVKFGRPSRRDLHVPDDARRITRI